MNILTKIQKNISEQLKSIPIKGVFFQPQQNPSFPYVLISEFSDMIKNFHQSQEHEICFKASLFSRDVKLNDISELTQQITSALLNIKELEIINISCLSNEIETCKDSITTKIALMFKITLVTS